MTASKIAVIILFSKYFSKSIDTRFESGNILVSKDEKEVQNMKLLITLNDTQEAKDFIKEIDHDELKENLDFYYPSNLDLTIKSEDIYVSFSGKNLWGRNRRFYSSPCSYESRPRFRS